MNQYRCETCKKFWQKTTYEKGCKNSGSIWNLSDETMAWIRDVGCASHSDFQSERKVLDESEFENVEEYTQLVQKKLLIDLCDTLKYGGVLSLVKRLDELREELRQAGGS